MKTFKYQINQGYDHFNAYPLFYVVGVNNEYFGEYHKTLEGAKKELNELKKVEL